MTRSDETMLGTSVATAPGGESRYIDSLQFGSVGVDSWRKRQGFLMLDPEKSHTETIARLSRQEPQQIRFRRTHRLPSRRSSVTVASSSYSVPERSRTTGLVFQAILGAAACLALVGVVAASQDVQPQAPIVNSGSPDAPPPAVFVHLN